jgi:hypothetical protein
MQNGRPFSPAWTLSGVLAVALIAACGPSPVTRNDVPVESGQVQVLIDFNGHAENKQFPMTWKTGLTAFGCLESLQVEGKLKVESRGTGSQTLLTAIDGLENRWSAGDNWIYLVNDRLGDRSSRVFELNSGDRVVWRFGKYTPD